MQNKQQAQNNPKQSGKKYHQPITLNLFDMIDKVLSFCVCCMFLHLNGSLWIYTLRRRWTISLCCVNYEWDWYTLERTLFLCYYGSANFLIRIIAIMLCLLNTCCRWFLLNGKCSSLNAWLALVWYILLLCSVLHSFVCHSDILL